MVFDQIVAIMEEIANPELAAEWDNSGVQLYVGSKEIKRVLVTLEITRDVIHEAKEKAVDLIITHHPLLFSPLRKVDNNTIIGNHFIELIKADISVYSAHTNFDVVDGGNSDYIAFKLNLANTEKFGGNKSYIGSMGELPAKMSFEAVCSYVKDALGLEHINVVGNPLTPIQKVGICSGAGSNRDTIDEAANSGCELYITGDVRYHDAQYALEKGICLIDAGHYGTEKFFVENLAAKLKKAIGSDVEIILSAINIDPFVTYP